MVRVNRFFNFVFDLFLYLSHDTGKDCVLYGANGTVDVRQNRLLFNV